MKWNLITKVWIVFLLLLAFAAYKERNTFPLRWSGYGVSIPPLAMVLVVIGVGVFVILWAKQQK
jgi:hypothetical protein